MPIRSRRCVEVGDPRLGPDGVGARLILDLGGRREDVSTRPGDPRPAWPRLALHETRPGVLFQVASTASAMTWTAPTGSLAGCVRDQLTPQT